MKSLQNKTFEVFFGDRGADLNSLRKNFPRYNFSRIRQTHSDIIVEASDEITEADAQFTAEPGRALVVATADCLPVLIHCSETSRVAAVHAGWKGIENKITEKTLVRLIATGSGAGNFEIFVGPHIQAGSFEVGQDVFQKLSESQYGLRPEEYSRRQDEKYFVDLNAILRSQIIHVLGRAPALNFFEEDTKTDLRYHSYRREPRNGGRNLSFIALRSAVSAK